MKGRIFLTLVMVISTLFSQNAQAYTAAGLGIRSCGAWTADRRYPNSLVALGDEAWVLGFLSGVGYSGKADPLQGTDGDGIWAWFDNYCAANPLNKIDQAGAAFVSFHPD